MTLKDQVWQALRAVPYPGYSRDIVSFGMVQHVAAYDGAVKLTLAIAHLKPETREALVAATHKALEALPEVRTLRIEVVGPPAIRPQRPAFKPQRAGIRHVLAVGSGKGGVGKSTVAVNLAVGLAQRGLRVGLMDADVYGPNLPRMLGVDRLRPAEDGKIVPAQAHGVRVVSLDFMVDQGQPVIWRGPMTDKLIRQFMADVVWGALDALVVDLPPGTGDIAISLASHARPDGAILVATPQEVTLDDARKAAGMFRRLDIPLLGLVENMSYFVCDGCEKRHDLFGNGGGRRLAGELNIPLLGEVPLVSHVREGGDRGYPAILQPGSSASAALCEVVEQVQEHLKSLPSREDSHPPSRTSTPELIQVAV